MSDSNDSKPRRPRLRAHCIAPLPAAALGLGFAASSLAGTAPPVNSLDDHFDVVARGRNDFRADPVGNALDNDTGDMATLHADARSQKYPWGSAYVGTDGTVSVQVQAACLVLDDTFAYVARDSFSQASANAFFHFIAPVAPDHYSTPVDQNLSDNIRNNDPFLGDPHYNALTFVLTSQPPYGSVDLQFSGQFDYSPDPAHHTGHQAFGYKLATQGTCNTIYQVNIDVYPVAQPDDFDTGYLQPVGGNLLANDLGNVLSVIGHTEPGHGSVNVASNGQFNYAPAAGFSGDDTFSYEVADQDGLNVLGIVHITVANAPPVAIDDEYSVITGQHVAGSVMDNDSDPNGDAITLINHIGPSYGNLGINGNGIFDYVAVGGYSGLDQFEYTIQDQNGAIANAIANIHVLPLVQADSFATPYLAPVSGSVLANDMGTNLVATVLSGPQHGVLNFSQDGSFSYQPSAGFSGTDSFDYAATDSSGQNAAASVSLVVGNATPVANADSASVVSGASVGGNVLGNDSDPNGDTLSVISHTDPTHGAVVIGGDGQYTYTPTSGYSGSDSFNYVASDGHGGNASASVALTVQPKATPDNYSTAFNTVLNGNVLDNDLGSTLQVNVVSSVLHGSLALYIDGHFDYTPNSGYSGADQFTYIVHDGSGQNAVATANIAVGNGSPVANPDSVTIAAGQVASGNVLSNDSDPNSGTLSVASHTAAAHGAASVQSDGTFTYTPVAGFSGTDQFTYVLSDGQGGNAVGTVNVLVTPVATTDTFGTGYQGPVSGNVLGNDLGSGLTVAVITPPQHGSLVLLPDGSFTYTPSPGYRGPDGFDYSITDSANSIATAHVSMAVAGPAAGPQSVPALDSRWMALMAGLLGWMGWRRRPRDR